MFGMKKVTTGLELMTLVGAVREPQGDDAIGPEGGLYLLFQGSTEENKDKAAVVWVARDAEGNGNGALHILPDPGEEDSTIIT